MCIEQLIASVVHYHAVLITVMSMNKWNVYLTV